ncbi:hypothetical protein Sinac_0421 [Singulisphaera acidiphila DSM 18658]|uniref:Uncharacterized protein n=1 Tax=Singulisphaera acidiphila (strain ATCC BAA-1392 / DSM 18658 / VKM B-2454 / MOB10) TaxID=886293 RepID=L0D7N4_SINAD|nr:hypothetical protein Sinac_0421 [Singulisphaera acidiphila DSM 18658]
MTDSGLRQDSTAVRCDVTKEQETIGLISNHIDLCVNRQDRFRWLEGRSLRPIAVDARGKLS